MPPIKPQILILGGTTEARLLAVKLIDQYFDIFDIVTSFAGVTQAPRIDAGKSRSGGFGGSAGLADYIKINNVIYLVDASHPFAAKMPFNAVEACKTTNCPSSRLMRGAWSQEPTDIWHRHEDLGTAALALPKLAKHAFLAVGSKDLAAFKNVIGCNFTARMIEEPRSEHIPKTCELIFSRPPYEIADEEALFSRLKIDILVTKNSGGGATKAKIIACRNLKIPILIVGRPAQPPVKIATSVDEAVNHIAKILKP